MKDCLNVSETDSSLIDVHWLEREVQWMAGFKLWQLIFLCGLGGLVLIIFLCCCIRFRIPRTKQEIEADYIRKKIAKKFQKQLRMIQDADMDEMDLKKALDRIREDFKSETESLAQSDALSGATLSSGNNRVSGDAEDKNADGPNANIGITVEDMKKNESKRSFLNLKNLAGIFPKFKSPQKLQDVLE